MGLPIVGLVHAALQAVTRSSAPSAPSSPPASGMGGLSGLPPPPPEPPQPPSCAPGTDGRPLFVARFGAFGWPLQSRGADVGTQPVAGGASLDAACEAAVAAGNCWLMWRGVVVTHPAEPWQLSVVALEDVLAVGEGLRVRLNPSAAGFAAMCARWGWLFPTERIEDALFAQAAVRLPTRTWNRGPWPAINGAAAVPGSATPNPGTGSAMMLNQAGALEAARAGRAGLVANAGKSLVSSIGLGFRAGTKTQIYGWHTSERAKQGGPFNANDRVWRPSAVIQSAGANEPHGAAFTDYANTARPVRRVAYLTGPSGVAEVVDLAAVYRSPQWSHLVRVGGGPLPIRLGAA